MRVGKFNSWNQGSDDFLQSFRTGDQQLSQAQRVEHHWTNFRTALSEAV